MQYEPSGVMKRKKIIEHLAGHRRPGSTNFAGHFDKLPPELIERECVPDLVGILENVTLPATIRDHTVGALGEIGDDMAVEFLVDALGSLKTRRGASVALGRMRVAEARDPLSDHALKVSAPRWALSELGPSDTRSGILEYLKEGRLHGLRGRINTLRTTQRRLAERSLAKQFSEKVD